MADTLVATPDPEDVDPMDASEGYPPDLEPGEQPITSHARSIRQRALQKQPNPPNKQPKQKKTKRINQTKILAKERQRKALELRKGGATYDAIAGALQYADASGARKAIERAMKQIIQEPTMEVRTLQIERCNHMLLTLWPQVQAGDPSAINTALRTMQQLDTYTGANIPTQVDVAVHHDGGVLVIDGSKDDYLAAMKRMVGIDGNGQNLPQLPSHPHAVSIDDGHGNEVDVIDADVVGDDDTSEPIEVAGNTSDPVDESVGVKTFDFGMDPEKYSKG